MKRLLLLISVLASTLFIFYSEGWAQTSASNEFDEFTLEEIVVTAEKREQDIQKTASSVLVVDGISMMELSKINVNEILDNIPNLTLVGGGTMQNQIVIRGVSPINTDPGRSEAASTAVYTDGVYGGMGSQVDLDHVEIMRGPQGTLYGRSAAGGVVAFHTKDPVIGEFNGLVTGQIGTADLINSQAVINIPLGEKIAFRVANHYYERGSYYSQAGGWSRNIYTRMKARYQPIDQLDTTLTFTHSISDNENEGNQPQMSSPTTFNYVGRDTEVRRSVTAKRIQVALDAKYDFGPAILNYISAIQRPYDVKMGPGMTFVHPASIMTTYGIRATDETWNHELRLNSDSEGRLSWIVGTNYYSWDYESISTWVLDEQYLPGNVVDPDPNTLNVIAFKDYDYTIHKQYGAFTENTYELRDDLRVTGGLRYDRTEVIQTMSRTENTNQNANGSRVTPYIWDYMSLDNNKVTFRHFTFKARMDYDLAPDKMIYAGVSDAYMPGQTSIARVTEPDPDTGEMVSRFVVSLIDQMQLISYEVGSKNRFFEDRLQLNAAAFYNDYEGYSQSIMLFTGGGPPQFIRVKMPVGIYGFELDTELLVTPKDKLSFSIGYTSSRIKEFPYVEGLGDSRQYFTQEKVHGVIPLEGNCTYQHTANFDNGSVLLSNFKIEFQDGYYTMRVSPEEAAMGNLPYSWQRSFWLGDIGATWTSPTGMFSLSGNVQNIMDYEYKHRIVLGRMDVESNQAWPGLPRTYSLILSFRF
jgi:iron complex outermembrane receptor protein